jgi:lantibiotic modifying enzyme
MTDDAPVSGWTLMERCEPRIAAILDAITSDLRSIDPASVSADLAGGAAGVALYFSYLARVNGDERSAADGRRWLAAAIRALPRLAPGPSLIDGVTGVAWAVNHVGDEQMASIVGGAVDCALLDVLALTPPERAHDLASGLAGFAVYSLAAPSTPLAGEVRSAILDRVEELAVEEDAGLTWPAPSLAPSGPRATCSADCSRLGVARGAPSIVGVLARYVAAGVEVERALPLLEGAMEWLIDATPLARGTAPEWRGPEDSAARRGVGHGDPGAVAAMLSAARATGNDAWEREATERARGLVRSPDTRRGVRDGGLCHGASGLGHLLHRLGRATGDDALLSAARLWIERVVAMARPGTGLGGFAALAGDIGFLNGAAGIGLALLSATSNVAPDWDQVLLIDVA